MSLSRSSEDESSGLGKQDETSNSLLHEDVERANEKREMMTAAPTPLREQLINAFCIVLNTVSTVGVVFMNKTSVESSIGLFPKKRFANR